MSEETLHKSAIVIDGLVVSRWSRQVFEDMHKGGLTAANCTCSIWDGMRDTMINIARWKQAFRDNADLIMQVRSAADIRKAKELGRVGILLGWQRRANPGRGRAPFVKGMESLASYPRLTEAMQRRGWKETRIRAVLGENWLRFLGESLEPRP